MVSWHRQSCRRPDVSCIGESLFCASCDTLVPVQHKVSSREYEIPSMPKGPCPDHMGLWWPKSVVFRDIINPLGRVSESHTCGAAPAVKDTSAASYQRETSTVHPHLQHANQIRLLLLSKGSHHDPIHATLKVEPLEQAPSFRALSYTWADSENDSTRCRVMYLGPEWDQFAITANCEAALRLIRHKYANTRVWIDAICIDQGNHTERSNQVRMMRQIYSAASEVFVYLGESNSGDVEALNRLRWANQDPNLDQRGRDNLHKLFEKSYFKRVWIIQEISNARSAIIHCGDESLGWSVIKEDRLRMLNIHHVVPQWICTMYKKGDKAVKDLLDILLSTSSTQASDPRDRVFATFGLIKDATENGLVADYALSEKEVLIGISAYLITHQGLEVLKYSASIYSFRCPSWVADWTLRSDQLEPFMLGKEHSSFVRAQDVLLPVQAKTMRGISVKPMIDQATGALELQGCILLHDLGLDSLISDPMVKLEGQSKNVVDKAQPQVTIQISRECHPKTQHTIVLFDGSECLFLLETGLQNRSKVKEAAGGPVRQAPHAPLEIQRYAFVGICRLSFHYGESKVPQAATSANSSSTDIHNYLSKCCQPTIQEIRDMVLLDEALRLLDGGLQASSRGSTLYNSDLPTTTDFDAATISTAFYNHICGISYPPKNEEIDIASSPTRKVIWLQSRLSNWESSIFWESVDSALSSIRDARLKKVRGLVEKETSNHKLNYDEWKLTKQRTMFFLGDNSPPRFFAKDLAKRLAEIMNILAIEWPALKDRGCRISIGDITIELFEDARRSSQLVERGLESLPKSLSWDKYFQYCDWDEFERILASIGVILDPEVSLLRSSFNRRRIFRSLQPQPRSIEKFRIF